MQTQILIFCLNALFLIAVFFLWKRERDKNLKLERWGIAHNRGGVPTVALEMARPVEMKIGSKTMYVGALSIEYGERWIKELGRFLGLYASVFDGVTQAEIDSGELGKVVGKLSGAFYNAVLKKHFRKHFIRLIKNTLLLDKANNVNKISASYLRKNLNHYNMAEMFWILYVYNHGGHIKKNYRLLGEALAKVSAGICDIVSQSPWSKAQRIENTLRSRLSGTPLESELPWNWQPKEKRKEAKNEENTPA